ncbi:MAG: hypothetical protein WD069_04360 [Planctomycetales bacterium]
MAQVRVAVHRQRDRRMPRQLLRGLRMHPGRRQVRNERMPQRVEVDDEARIVLGTEEVRSLATVPRFAIVAAFVEPLRPGRLEIATEHFGRLARPRSRPQRRVAILPGPSLGKPLRQCLDEVRVERKHVLPAALAVARLDGHGRRIGSEIETRLRQARELVRP